MNRINEDGETLEPGEPNEPLRDESLRKALAQAPDRSQLPDWRVRQAILEHAHDATSASEDLLAASRQGAPWWSLAFWREKVGLSGATPWNAALATVVVGVMVTLLWQREPVPGARLDERAASPAPAAKDDAPRQEAQRAAAAPAAPAASGADSKSAESAAARTSPAPVPTPAPAPAPIVPPPAPAAPSANPSPATPSAPSRTQARPLAPTESPPLVPQADAPARQPAAPPPPTPEASQERRKSELAAVAPAAPTSPAAAPEGKRGAASRQEAASAAPPARAEAAPALPDFASLSRWTEMRLANVSGDVRVVPRSEAGELGLLMSSAAIMAVGGPPMRSLPEWRVSLERKGQVLAVLEVARGQVRWTEGNLPSSTGNPPVESLDALRADGPPRIAWRSAARAEPAAPAVRAPRAEPPAQRPEAASPPDPSLLPPPVVAPPVSTPPVQQ